MISRSEADEAKVQAVLKFMEMHADAYDEETLRKTSERAVVVEDPSRSGCIVVDVERHRSVFGDGWEKGKRMHALITYWERYALNANRTELEKLGIVRPSEFDFDHAIDLEMEDYSYSVERLEDGRFEVSEAYLNNSEIVNSLEEAPKIADKHAAEISDDYFLERAADVMLPSQIAEFLAKIRTIVARNLRAKIEAAWNERE
jgi:hypothetical protein